MRGLPIALLLLAGAVPALANDSTAELRTGGLQLTKTDDIEMRSEDLFISTDEVRVRYRFFNKQNRDVSTIVAFPMPDIALNEDGEDLALPRNAGDNFLDFATNVDGKPVAATLEQHAVVGGADMTDHLRQVGSSLLPQLNTTAKYLEALPSDKQNQLVKLGLVGVDDSDSGPGGRRHLQPKWTLKSLYAWTQVFPAGREIVVEHRYRPSVGVSVGTGLTAAGGNDADYIRKYCIEPSLLDAIRHAKAAGTDGAPLGEQRVSYILKTGANWAKPIEDFRLVVDKGNPANLVSFCGSAIEKIGPTQFEMRRKNFRPDTDVDILILTKSKR